MLGNLKKSGRVFEITAFNAPDTVFLKGQFSDFETSLSKSFNNGYELESDDVSIVQEWKKITEGKAHE